MIAILFLIQNSIAFSVGSFLSLQRNLIEEAINSENTLSKAQAITQTFDQNKDNIQNQDPIDQQNQFDQKSDNFEDLIQKFQNKHKSIFSDIEKSFLDDEKLNENLKNNFHLSNDQFQINENSSIDSMMKNASNDLKLIQTKIKLFNKDTHLINSDVLQQVNDIVTDIQKIEKPNSVVKIQKKIEPDATLSNLVAFTEQQAKESAEEYKEKKATNNIDLTQTTIIHEDNKDSKLEISHHSDVQVDKKAKNDDHTVEKQVKKEDQIKENLISEEASKAANQQNVKKIQENKQVGQLKDQKNGQPSAYLNNVNSFIEGFEKSH